MPQLFFRGGCYALKRMEQKQEKTQDKKEYEYTFNINLKVSLDGLKTALGNPLNDILKNIQIGVIDTKKEEPKGGKK